MIWVYAIVAAFVLAAGVAVVETYNHAVAGAATAKIRADQADQRAAIEHRSKENLQELVDYGDDLGKKQQQDLAIQAATLRAMEEKIRVARQADPKGFACEDTAVPSAVRELRRNTFGADTAGSVLHPAGQAAADSAATPAGRDVRATAPGSGSGPQAAPLVQQRQVDSPPDPREAKPAAESIRSRLESLMHRR